MRSARLIFRLAAVSNWLVSAGGFLAPVSVASLVGMPPPNYPFLVRIWCGMVFMFGAMFWEISGDPVSRQRLIKYAWIEKSVTAFSVSLAYLDGSAPGFLLVLIVFTDYLWIPIFIYYQIRLRSVRQ